MGILIFMTLAAMFILASPLLFMIGICIKFWFIVLPVSLLVLWYYWANWDSICQKHNERMAKMIEKNHQRQVKHEQRIKEIRDRFKV